MRWSIVGWAVLVFAGYGLLAPRIDAGTTTIVHKTTEFSEARKNPAAVVTTTQAVFAGGRNASTYSDRVDFYDIQTRTWSTGALPDSITDQQAAATQDVAVFAGGIRGGARDFAFVFDDATTTFDFQYLSEPREEHAAAAVGHKILFAGGWTPAGRSSSVDVYNVVTNSWTTDSLSIARNHLAAAATDDLVMFAGGRIDYGGVMTDIVDVYHAATDLWTTKYLSQPRSSFAGVFSRGKVFFGGGVTTGFVPSDVVDIYDVTTDQWTVAHLSQARHGLVAAAAGGYVFFAGGIAKDGLSNIVDVYDIHHDSWSVLHLSQARDKLAAVSMNNKVMFAGGALADGSVTSRVDVFTVVTSVDIDIKPGSHPNSINLGSKGVVPVAILASDTFDPVFVDADTIELAGAGVAIRGKGNNLMVRLEDVNDDGLPDLVCQVETENLDPGAFDNGWACLTGETFDGMPFEGHDEITIVPP